MPMYQRPAFWRVPHRRMDPEDDEPRDFGQRRKVTPGTPAGRELLRGDIIAKIDDYDARDLRHEDAQNLFKNAPNQIKLAVQRDIDREAPRSAGAMLTPRSPIPHFTPAPYRATSPMGAAAWRGPESLPRSTPGPTPVPAHYGPPSPRQDDYRNLFSPTSTRTDDTFDESIGTQPYRTTPLVLPGAKVRREPGPTESYLRHHPNPAMRAPPTHDYRDTLMKQKYKLISIERKPMRDQLVMRFQQRMRRERRDVRGCVVRDVFIRPKVAESVLQRVVSEEGNKMVHKQFNSPINLYSDQNIANSIRQQSSPLPHKPTVVFDPAKSEAFRALQEDGLGDVVQEVPVPLEHKVFQPPTTKKPVPTPKPPKQIDVNPKGKQTTFVNSLHEEHIQQSNSFKRLMYNFLGDTEF